MECDKGLIAQKTKKSSWLVKNSDENVKKNYSKKEIDWNTVWNITTLFEEHGKRKLYIMILFPVMKGAPSTPLNKPLNKLKLFKW